MARRVASALRSRRVIGAANSFPSPPRSGRGRAFAMNATFTANANFEEGTAMFHRNDKVVDATSDTATTADFALGRRVRVYPGSSDERLGIIVEDFGDDAGGDV